MIFVYFIFNYRKNSDFGSIWQTQNVFTIEEILKHENASIRNWNAVAMVKRRHWNRRVHSLKLSIHLHRSIHSIMSASIVHMASIELVSSLFRIWSNEWIVRLKQPFWHLLMLDRQASTNKIISSNCSGKLSITCVKLQLLRFQWHTIFIFVGGTMMKKMQWQPLNCPNGV